MSASSIYRWQNGSLAAIAHLDMTDIVIEAADSWLVTAGATLAIDLHRTRFLAAVRPALSADPSTFWDAAVALIPRESDWFPRVEQHATGQLLFRLRSAPERTRSVVVATWMGAEPRTTPRRKGPDLETMGVIRNAVQASDADEAVILSPDGYVAEGAYSGLLWWRGEILCGPADELDRIDSVTTRSVLTLATALGVETFAESVTPTELDGVELWALSALHGIRIVTRWTDGPSLAEKPGRLELWRKRLDALRQPLGPAAR